MVPKNSAYVLNGSPFMETWLRSNLSGGQFRQSNLVADFSNFAWENPLVADYINLAMGHPLVAD